MIKKILFGFSFLIALYSNSYSADEYFLTLRNDKVNLRQGPSHEYPVKIFYKKKFLPVLIQDNSDKYSYYVIMPMKIWNKKILAKNKFTKCAEPFGILVAGSKKMSDFTVLQTAKIIAELLDQNRDGKWHQTM